jgi:hypothetical protein
VPLDQVLSLGAFDLQRALERDDAFLQTPRPFEWAGLWQWRPGRIEVHCGSHDHAHDHDHGAADHDHAQGLLQVDVALMRANGTEAADLDILLNAAGAQFDGDPVVVMPGGLIRPGQRNRLQLKPGASFELDIPSAGAWALFTEHAPAEFGMHLHAPAPAVERSFGSHHHDLAVGSIGLTDERPLDTQKVNNWLSYLLQSRGEDILRMKGVLNLKDESRRFVFHGVHMMFDGQFERPWSADAVRVSRMVFIGRDLDRHELEAGLESCVA